MNTVDQAGLSQELPFINEDDISLTVRARALSGSRGALLRLVLAVLITSFLIFSFFAIRSGVLDKEMTAEVVGNMLSGIGVVIGLGCVLTVAIGFIAFVDYKTYIQGSQLLSNRPEADYQELRTYESKYEEVAKFCRVVRASGRPFYVLDLQLAERFHVKQKFANIPDDVPGIRYR
jgi:hypothetical protein